MMYLGGRCPAISAKPYRTYILTSPVHEIGIDSVVNEKYIIHCKHCAYCEIRKHRGIFCEDDEIITFLCQNPHGMCSDRQVHEEDFCSRAVSRTQFLPHGKCDCRDLEVNVFVNNDNTFTYKLCCRFCNEDEVSVTGKFNVDEALELLRDEWNQRSINSYKAKVRNFIRKR